MPATLFTDGQKPVVTAAWLNEVGFVLYDLLGNGTNIPATRAELLSNIGGSGGGGGGSGNTTYQQETAPPSPVVGDLWQVPSTGLMSRWNGSVWVIFGDIAGPAAAAAQTTANAAQAAATSASSAAAAATAAIAAISSDNVLSSGEKSAVLLDYNTLVNEQAGIDNQATAFTITTEKTAYDSAMTGLTNYLANLTTPTLWSDTSGDTTIVGSTFRANFGSVYSSRQTLLNKIATVSKAVADNALTNAATAAAAAATAQAAANAASTAAATAQTGATSALNQLTSIASDNVLSQVEKPAVILDYTGIGNESSGIDAQAVAYGISTERTNYENAYNALGTYLATLTSPVAWNNLSGDTTIVGSTFRTNFAAYYSTRQLLLNEIARVAGTVATWAGVSGVAVTTAQLVSGAATETFFDAHNFAGAAFGVTTARTFSITPVGSGTMEFTATLREQGAYPDGGATVDWKYNTGGADTGINRSANYAISAEQNYQFEDIITITGGVTYNFHLDVNKGGGPNITLYESFVRLTLVKR